MTDTDRPTLQRVIRYQLSSGKYRYVGYFSNGTAEKLRESAHSYATVAQLWYPPRHGGPDFCFSRNAAASIPKFAQLAAQVPVEDGQKGGAQ